ncbi:hypothetical protein QN277_016716 [Acacia crassicarpa]|nr:hypothetical protein QN277_016716 [Acacia crassicarpa]
MASENEKSHVGLVELEELEVMEIDEALLRELLEEQGVVEAEGECLVQSVENDNKMMEEKVHKQEGSNSKQREDYKGAHSLIEVVEPASQNEVILNWYPDDTIGMMTDFGFANGELCSQSSEGFVSYDAYYGCLWEDM